MINEFLWYVQPDRFTSIAQQIDDAVTAYGQIKKEAGGEKEKLRESARRLCESHLINSGLREAEQAFINIDAEFFDGDTVNRKNLDTFIKEILKAHCYQKVLWEYMGTTGTFTCISKLAMKGDGFEYEKYLPAAYKRRQKEKKETLKSAGNTIKLYAYSDGSVSETYNSDKARLRFNALSDSSGFNWKKGYDPNDTVHRQGWYGTFDEDGVWVKVNEKENKREIGSITNRKIHSLRLVKEGETALLYDPEDFLLNAALLMYLTDSGQPYAVAQADTEETVALIAQAMEKMGVKQITQIAVAGKNEKTPAALSERPRRYKTVLGSLAADTLQIIGEQEFEKKLELQQAEETQHAAAATGVLLERLIRAVPAADTVKTVQEALSSGGISVPVRVKNREDARDLGLDEKEFELLETLAIPPEKETQFNTALGNLLRFHQRYPISGITARQLIEETYKQIIGNTQSGLVVSAEKTVARLCTENAPLPGMIGEIETVDFTDAEQRDRFFSKLVNTSVLNEEMARTAKQTLETAGVQRTGEQQEKTNRAVSRALYSYKSIAASTGMTVREILTEALRDSGGRRETPSGAGTNGRVQGVQNSERKVYTESPLSGLIKSASEAPPVMHTVPLEKINGVFNQTEVLFIGGETGQNGVELLKTHTKIGAKGTLNRQLAKTLKMITVNDLAPESQKKEIAGQIAALISQPAKNVSETQKTLLAYLDNSPFTGYNLANTDGLSLYTQSERCKAAGLEKKQLGELTRETLKTTAEQVKTTASISVSVKPQYKTKESVLPGRIPATGIPPVVRAVPSQSAREQNSDTQNIPAGSDTQNVSPFLPRQRNETRQAHGNPDAPNVPNAQMVRSSPVRPEPSSAVQPEFGQPVFSSAETVLPLTLQTFSAAPDVVPIIEETGKPLNYRPDIINGYQSPQNPQKKPDSARSPQSGRTAHPVRGSTAETPVTAPYNTADSYAKSPAAPAAPEQNPAFTPIRFTESERVTPHAATYPDFNNTNRIPVRKQSVSFANENPQTSYKPPSYNTSGTDGRHPTNAETLSLTGGAGSLPASDDGISVRLPARNTDSQSPAGPVKNRRENGVNGLMSANGIKGSNGKPPVQNARGAFAETGIPVISENSLGYGQNPPGAQNGGSAKKNAQPVQNETGEEKRLRRIEANYERDKAQLKKEQPALARSATYEIGHAEGSGKKQRSAERKRMNSKIMNEVKRKLRRKN